MTAFLPMWLSASPSPTVVVVFPSPAGVGLMAVTRISLPSGLSLSVSMYSSEILALVRPNGSMADSGMPSWAAISPMGFIFDFWAISMSDSMNGSPRPDSSGNGYWVAPSIGTPQNAGP